MRDITEAVTWFERSTLDFDRMIADIDDVAGKVNRARAQELRRSAEDAFTALCGLAAALATAGPQLQAAGLTERWEAARVRFGIVHGRWTGLRAGR